MGGGRGRHRQLAGVAHGVLQNGQANKMEDDMFLRCIEANVLSDLALQVEWECGRR